MTKLLIACALVACGCAADTPEPFGSNPGVVGGSGGTGQLLPPDGGRAGEDGGDARDAAIRDADVPQPDAASADAADVDVGDASASAGSGGSGGTGGIGGTAGSGSAGTAAVDPCELGWFRDADGDGYGDPDEPHTCFTDRTGFVANDRDCYDGSAVARPTQTEWFTKHRGDGSFDYNCDGTSEMLWTGLGSCPVLDPSCPPPNQWPAGFECDYAGLTVYGSEGWARVCIEVTVLHGSNQCAEYGPGTDAACGVTAAWKWNAAQCPGSTQQRQQKCR